jgi:SAM-dependent methyltransferase
MTGEVTKQIIRDWWAAFPQTYGTVDGHATYRTDDGRIETFAFGTREFFEHVDRTFYQWTDGFHTEAGFFAKLFPYEQYRHRDVLEIGCGLGTMAMNWAQQGAHIVAVDLNPVAVAQTTRRFELYGLTGRILQMDAHSLSFPDQAFDYVYSWGVLHHSSDLQRSLHEAFRVLRPGGGFGIMLYNRRSVFYWYRIRYLKGYLHGESRCLTPLELASRYTDGWEDEGNPYTWPVTRSEVRRMLRPYSADVRIVAGGSIDFGLPPTVQAYLPRVLKNAWARRWGWSLWITGTKC